MPEKIKPELLQLIEPSALPCRILVVESLAYLPRLREMFPRGELLACADDPELALAGPQGESWGRMGEIAEQGSMEEFFGGLGVEFTLLDYLSRRLPYAPESLDYIICDLALERAGNPQDIAAGFSTYLKQTGALLTSFRNIRFWEVIEELQGGHYYQVVSRLYARPEFERLLYASFYKFVRFATQRRTAPPGRIAALTAAGFENIQGDLETEFYLVRADRSMPEMALLKSMYTPEERGELSRLLHRIEYGIELARSAESFWSLWEKLGLFTEYAGQFVQEAVCHHERFYQNLRRVSPGREREITEMEERGEV